MSHYGHFSKTGDEYIINRPDTPKPWINLITNGKYCALVSQTGGGYSFVGDAGYNRILKEQPGEELIYDRPGRYIYVRDNETKEIWGLTWQPNRTDYQFFEARHGLGYTKVNCITNGIDGKVTYFVPLEDTCEIWMTNIKNKSNKKRDLSLFVYVEWSLGNHHANLAEASFNDLFNDLEYEDGAIFATKRRWDRPDIKVAPWDKVAFLTINTEVDGFDCFKEKFTGMYGSLDKPLAVQEGKCSGSKGDGHHSVGALQKNVILNPGEELSFDVILGTEERENFNLEKQKWSFKELGIDKHIIKKYKKHEAVESAFEELTTFWHKYINRVTVKTPDPDFNTSFNYWNKYQAWMTVQWSLMDSYYVGGSATFGFRDMNQHILGTLPNDIELSKERLVTLLSYQYSEGKTVHNWDALLKKGVITDHSDDTMWLVMAVINYIEETGDIAFLEETVSYHDDGEATVFQHIVRAIEFTLTHCSNRGIPHRRTADWNDALDGGKEGKGESAMVANQLCYNLRKLFPILEKAHQDDLTKRYRAVYEKVKRSLNKDFWDGKWYIRATLDDGSPIGSHLNREAKIDINGQTWPVMSGVADYKRGVQVMDSVWKYLMTDYGPTMFSPPFDEPSKEFGIISQFTPGTKENGAIFNHPVSWAVIAECMLGRGDKAYEIWRRTSFMTRGKNPELYRVEPYVYAEFVYGPPHPELGRGSFTWTTGSASWFWRACLDYICGVRPVLDGLMIDPCIPKEWGELEVKRAFRGGDYYIKIKNPLKVMTGVGSIKADGKEITGNIIPDLGTGHHIIEVVMGKDHKKSIQESHKQQNERIKVKDIR
ncbi:MAG: glycosyl transferase family 36 [bacterium]|nr:glycosyl transferase family 36 [bacterium]